MKKNILFLGILLSAIALGIAFYIINIPQTVSAIGGTVHDDPTGHYCRIMVGSETVDYRCDQIFSHEGNPPGPGQTNCASDGTCTYTPNAGGGSYSGSTVEGGVLPFFSAALSASFLQDGGTSAQLNSFDDIYRTCLDLIAANPKAESFVCGGTGGSQCVLLSTGTPVDQSYCNGGAGCGGATSGATASSVEFNPLNPGFGTITLRRGSSGTEVLNLQKFLIAQGHIGIIADGKFGPGTEAAVKSFQVSAGLTPDGVFGAASRAIIGTTLPSTQGQRRCAGKWECSADAGTTTIYPHCVKADPNCTDGNPVCFGPYTHCGVQGAAF